MSAIIVIYIAIKLKNIVFVLLLAFYCRVELLLFASTNIGLRFPRLFQLTDLYRHLLLGLPLCRRSPGT